MSALTGRLGTLTARDVMTRALIVLRDNDTLDEAVRLLRSHHITGAPVINGRGRLVGILSMSDLIGLAVSSAAQPAAALAHGTDPAAWDLFEKAEPMSAGSGQEAVSSRMSQHVTSVTEDTPLVEVARVLCDGHWHRVPVVDAAGALRGIISSMDILAALVNAADEA